MLLEQFLSLIVALLVVAAGISFATGDAVEGFAIVAVLLLNALIGFGTEWSARRALDALKRQAHATARVRRDGRESILDAADLVAGDVIVLSAGDRVPADVRVLEATGLRAEEAALTGESAAVTKGAAPAPTDAPLAERTSMLFQGTTVSAGRGVAIVTATGARTELGHIGRLVAEAEQEQTPLERRLGELGKRLVYVVMGIAVLVFLVGWLRGGGEVWETVEVAISLAVAAVPEGLPTVTTLVLALGVLRMAKQNAIVRRLPAVETLGSTTVICTDKTGTLTQNRMTVREFRLSNGAVASWEENGADVPPNGDALLTRAARVCVLCNEASWDGDRPEEERAVGDPTETALLVAAADRLGTDVDTLRRDWPLRDERPFDSDTKRMITVHAAAAPDSDGDTRPLAALKGAPGSGVLDLCGTYVDESGASRPLDDTVRKRILALNEEMADRALRVLALAEKRLESAPADGAVPDALLADGYTYLGLVGMIDPPRPEAGEAVRRAHEAGIRTVMLTGDQVNTARAIAAELHLGNAPVGRDGSDAKLVARHARDLAGVNGEALAQMARETDVFARVSPEEKLRIVESLQQAGEVVAVTGDGVNDAPALKRADIGVAMGLRGTEVAKEAADVVLADDNFATIVQAVEGGRTIYANLLKFVHLLFSANLAEVLVIFVASAIGWPLPLTPLQILWVNLVTDVFPAFALAVEPAEADVMRRPPRSPKESLLSREFLGLIAWQAVLLSVVVLAAYGWALRAYGPGAHARTVALLALVGVQLAQMFNCRSRWGSAFAGLFRNGWLWAAAAAVIALQFLAVSLPPLVRVMGTATPRSSADLLIAVGAVLVPIAVVEAVKAVTRAAR
jgi:Ca2+-transporting ATPase